MYQTIQGDTWDIISMKVYGSIGPIGSLMDANRTYIDTVIFSGGIDIVVPVIAVEQSSKLPPWKR